MTKAGLLRSPAEASLLFSAFLSDHTGAGETANRTSLQHSDEIQPSFVQFWTDTRTRERPDVTVGHTHKGGGFLGLVCRFQGQRQIEQVVQRVDMDKDIQRLLEEHSSTNADYKAEFLMADYFVSL